MSEITPGKVGQHPVTARHANLLPNAQPLPVTYGVSSALSRRVGDNTDIGLIYAGSTP